MILCIVLLILFLLLLILFTFFTIYFIIPSIKGENRTDDPIIPNVTLPQKLFRQKNITPYDTVDFIEKIVMPVSLEEKLQMLNGNSYMDEEIDSTVQSSEKPEDIEKKDFKIWEYCYRILKHFNKF